MALFTHLKFILLQYFQFSIFNSSKISFIQTNPKTSSQLKKTAYKIQEIYLMIRTGRKSRLLLHCMLMNHTRIHYVVLIIANSQSNQPLN